MLTSQSTYIIRYEALDGLGLFHACGEFVDLAIGEGRRIRSRTRKEREIESLYDWLRNHTSPVPASAYKGDRCRFPYTWFKSSAGEHIRRAERLSMLLNREGMNITRIDRPMPVRPLWEDDVQVVTRRPRGPKVSPLSGSSNLSARIARRRARQARRRLRAGRATARRMKSDP